MFRLRRATETGLLERQRNIWHGAKPKCVRNIAPNDLIVEIDKVYSAILLLFTGYLISINILIIECLCYRIFDNRLQTFEYLD